MTHPDTAKALEALNDIVTAYCLSLGMKPPIPEPESQTAEQVQTITSALTAQKPEPIEGLGEALNKTGRTPSEYARYSAIRREAARRYHAMTEGK